MSNMSTLKNEVETAVTGVLARATSLETSRTADETNIATNTANIATNTTNITELQGAGTKALSISFATGETGTYKVYFPSKVTINKIRGFVRLALAGTDSGTVTAQDASSNPMTGGVLTFPASSAFGFQPTPAVPTDHNVVLAGSFIQLVVAKTTQGGNGYVEIEYTVTP